MKINLMDEAMKIPPNDRVILAELMLESIDYEDSEIKQAWLSEVTNRIQSVQDGKSVLLDFDMKC